MSRKPVKKSFDCLAFKRQVQGEIYEDIKNMTNEEQREYFRKRAESGPLGKWWKKVKRLSEQGAGPKTPRRRTAGARARKAS